jgi:hypothetical protein
MSYSKRMICLANSYKPPSGRCVAGIELLEDGNTGGWLRPVSARPGKELTYTDYRYQDGSVPRLLDIIDVPFVRSEPHGHQIENHLIDTRYYWTKVGTLAWKDLKKFQDKPDTLWPNVDHTRPGLFDCLSSEIASCLNGSLLLVHVEDFEVEVGINHFSRKQTFRGKFTYNDVHHNFSVTDPSARDAFGSKGDGNYPVGDAYLCLSLTEPFEKDGRCHKLVAGILTKSPL